MSLKTCERRISLTGHFIGFLDVDASAHSMRPIKKISPAFYSLPFVCPYATCYIIITLQAVFTN